MTDKDPRTAALLGILLILLSPLGAGDIVPGVLPDQTVEPKCTQQVTIGDPDDDPFPDLDGLPDNGPDVPKQCTPRVFAGEGGEGSGLNADLLDGIDSTGFLAVGGKAMDADKLDGLDSTAFLPLAGKAADANLLDGLDSTAFLGVGAKAADADKLDGLDSTAFLPTAAKAADADRLDGIDSTAFLLASGTAANADKLDGQDSSAFLGATAKAADADRLDGLDSSQVLLKDQSGTLTGDLTVTGTVRAQNGVLLSGTTNVAVNWVYASTIVDISSLGLTDTNYRIMATPYGSDAGSPPDGHGPLYTVHLFGKTPTSFGIIVYDINNGAFAVTVPVDWAVVR